MGGFPMDDPANRGVNPTGRKTVRSAIDAQAVLRRSGQCSYRVILCDLSPSGCKLEVVERPLLDEVVWVKIGTLEALEASVCWIDGFSAGLEFRHQIHPAVFEHLLRKLGSHSS